MVTDPSLREVERERMTPMTTVKTGTEAGGATASSQANANAPRRTTNHVRSYGRCSSHYCDYCPTTQTETAASPAR